MSVRKREGKRRVYWDVRFYGGMDPATGKKIETTKRGFHTESEASDYERKLVMLQQEGKLDQALKGTTVAELYELWWTEHVSQHVRESTAARWRYEIDRHIIPELGTVQLRALTPLRIQQWITKLMDPGNGKGRNGNGFAHSSGQRFRMFLSTMLRWAVKMGLLDSNPAKYVTVPGKRRFKPVVVAPEMANRILGIFEGSHWHGIIFTAFYTGLRRSELGGLRWSRVDLEDGWLAVEESRVYFGSSWIECDPKTDSSKRRIALSGNLIRLLRDWRSRQKEIYRKASRRWSENEYVFCDPQGVELNLETLSAIFGRTLAKAGIDGIRFHDTRHAHATALFLRGVHPKIVQERLGHSSLQMTLDVYSHLIRDQAVFAASEVDRAMGPGEWVQSWTNIGQNCKVELRGSQCSFDSR